LQQGQTTTLPRSFLGTCSKLKQFGQETLNDIGGASSVEVVEGETLNFEPFSISHTSLAGYIHVGVTAAKTERPEATFGFCRPSGQFAPPMPAGTERLITRKLS
jgi:hypothetical protein